MLEEVIQNYYYSLRRHFQYLIDDDYPAAVFLMSRTTSNWKNGKSSRKS